MPSLHTILFHVLFAIFGTGSWLAINGIFAELSFLVQTAPESWNLASGLSLTIQLGNILPFIYVVLGQVCNLKVRENYVIYFILAVGCVSSVLLAFLWDRTLEIGGQSHSFYLFLFTLTLAAVDCTSSVTYFPFLAKFPEKFVVSLMIGEGLSGLIPSVLALIQDGGTVKMTSTAAPPDDSFLVELNGSTLEPTSNSTYCYTQSKFSEKVFFLMMFVLFFISGVAFFLLNVLSPPASASKRKTCQSGGSNRSESSNEGDYEEQAGEEEQEKKLLSRNGVLKPPHVVIQGVEVPHSDLTTLELARDAEDADDDKLQCETITSSPTTSSTSSILHSLAGIQLTATDVCHYSFLFIVCFLFNGALPSISTYILMPYGNEEMLIVSNIGNIANPLTCIVMMFLPLTTSLLVSSFSSILTLALSAVLTVFAVTSPPWTDVGAHEGIALTGCLWVLFKVVATIARVVQANVSKSKGKDHLFLYGTVTQAGSFTGALVFYYLCHYTNLFTPVYASC